MQKRNSTRHFKILLLIIVLLISGAHMQGAEEEDNKLKPVNVERNKEGTSCSLRKNVQGANQMLYANLSQGFKNDEELTEGNEKTIKTFTREEVAEHNTKKDAWIIYKNKVYEITYYLLFHPGGEDILAEQAGNDITDYVFQYHPWVNVERILENNYKGDIAE
ncbi:heme binding protein, putative [Plasmodium knowlesi strain H]|uniref:Heme binding protein, putative n=3 Tax=Plasmodium knowlesi TaxID=5850 RepID=A0A5K1VEM1_PLAKH|nr:heme binding protein, putative [Plasmodium knowlesi strain H]OTN67536.1 putative Heme binding protein [Plasmodium knowlesi]CAA9987452.1 heme binding protein, putative [Plasmodium knowlesi strain H]SBO23238.1 heme binding protein, putative [Plasmodium knowlesi strain H]SBO24087.1 heme binding protein, putative [Plasmodium knowlesi strain H]VVS76926.1 heme binding protein, putative [Plasmodium knowlesi strain H]|eukprot:XP_002258453.1 Heme binding protein, putative [Plasmodium knowlesi strain H]